MRAIKKLKRGFTLVELMIVVAIVGVLAALAIYGVRKYVLNAKTAEARNSLGQMSKDASTAYSREGMDGTVLTLGKTAGVTNRLCSGANATVPATKGDIQGRKYQSAPNEWADVDTATGWPCVKFSMQDPQYYLYDYTTSSGTVAAGDTFTTWAKGDLDGDGVTSEFSLAGEIKTDGTELTVVIAPNLVEVDGEE